MSTLEDRPDLLAPYSPSEIRQRLTLAEFQQAQRLKQEQEAERRRLADSLLDSFCLTGSDRPADDPNQNSLF